MELGIKGKQFRTLGGVPVDADKFDAMRDVLSQHGGKVVGTTDEDGKYRVCTFEFPEGTIRVDHEIRRESMRFTIYFPDGYALPGKHIYHGHNLEKTSTVLYFPREQQPT